MNNKIFLLAFSLLIVLFLLIDKGSSNSKESNKSIRPFNDDKINKELTLNKIFDSNDYIDLQENNLITVIATGDVILARAVNSTVTNLNNFKWPFEKTNHFLKSADITLINLESPLVENCKVTNTGMTFCADLRHLQGILSAGVDVANLSNNHSGNYGLEGIESTKSLLSNAGIIVSGANKPIYKNVKNTKIAFLGYNDIGYPEDGLSWAFDDQIKKEISDVRNQADIIIVSFHWGTEYVSLPTKRQIFLSHLAIDSGADLIIGNHPHWIQPIEIYKGKLITYAHGNFIFDQTWSEKTKTGILGKYFFHKNHLIGVKFYPTYINGYGQPDFLDEQKSKIILDEIKNNAFLLENILHNL